MKEITTPAAPMTDAEYEAEADRYLEAIRNLRQRESEGNQEFQRSHVEIMEMLADVHRRLVRAN